MPIFEISIKIIHSNSEKEFHFPYISFNRQTLILLRIAVKIELFVFKLNFNANTVECRCPHVTVCFIVFNHNKMNKTLRRGLKIQHSVAAEHTHTCDNSKDSAHIEGDCTAAQ